MKTFNYKPSNPFSGKLGTIGFCAFMIILPFVFPFGIRLGSFRIPESVVSIFFIVVGVALLLFTLYEIREAQILIKNGGGVITVEGDEVSYPVIQNKKIEYRKFLISDIESIKYDEEEMTCYISVSNSSSPTLEVRYFDNLDVYKEFRNLLGH